MRSLIAILVITLTTLSASAKDRDPVLIRWDGWMAETVKDLKSNDYKSALKRANRTIKEMIDQLGPGHASTELFGTVLTYKALAHAGLGEQEAATWDWQTVLALYPKFAESDMSMFGEPGAFLKTISAVPQVPEETPPANAVRPVLRKQAKPKFPHGAHYFGVTGELIVQVTVMEDGRVTSPAILKPLPAPTLSYVALEAVRRWRFDPAKLDGQPVPFMFVLTINYKA